MDGYIQGPWGVESTSTMLWVGPMRPDGEEVDEVVVGLSYDHELTHATKCRQQAFARAIAAVPDLVEALLRLIPDDFDEHPGDFADDWHQARAALSKALGDGQ